LTYSPVCAALNHEKQPSLSNKHTSWDDFRQLINERLTLKTEEDIEAAVKFLNDTIQWSGWNATPEHIDTLKTYDCPILIKQKIEEKKKTPYISTNYKHQTVKDCLTQHNRNPNNS
jgi:hypothetical protein